MTYPYVVRFGDLIARLEAAEQEVAGQGRRIEAAAEQIGESTRFMTRGFKKHAAHMYHGGDGKGLRFTGHFG